MPFFGLIKNKSIEQNTTFHSGPQEAAKKTLAYKSKLSRSVASQNFNYDFTNPMIDEMITSSGVVLFAQDNMYPQLLNELVYMSPLHSSIVRFKRMTIAGKGYTITPQVGISELDKIRINQFELLVDGKRSLNELVSDLVMDFVIHERICIKVDWNEDHTAIRKMVRVAPEKVRFYKKNKFGEIDKLAFNDNWRGYSINNSTIPYPAFDQYAKGEHCQMFVHQLNSPGLNYYNQPSYSPALNWCFLDGSISQYQKSNILNSINPSIIIQLKEQPANQEEMDSILRNLMESYAGPTEAGLPFVTVSPDTESMPNIIQMNGNALDKTFNVTQEIITKQICYSHSIDPVILGIATGGALGQTQQLQEAYNIYNDTVVVTSQKFIEDVINKFLFINKIPATFKLNSITFANAVKQMK
jgi:hypothetical protein